MMIKELIGLLLAHSPSAQAYFMTQRKQPFENHIAGVVSRAQMADQHGCEEEGIAGDDVFLTVGKRIRPGSLSAWILPERAEREGVVPLESWECDRILDAIAEEFLDIDLLAPSADLVESPQHFLQEDVLGALAAAYHAGIAKAFGQPHQASLNEGAPASSSFHRRSVTSALQLGEHVMCRVNQHGLQAGDLGTVEGLREVRTPRGIATTVTVQFGERRVVVHNPEEVLALAHIDAHGVQGPHRAPWRVRFGDTSEMEAWCRNNDATVLGQRFVDATEPEEE
jgi:hypothetical protein